MVPVFDSVSCSVYSVDRIEDVKTKDVQLPILFGVGSRIHCRRNTVKPTLIFKTNLSMLPRVHKEFIQGEKSALIILSLSQ